MKVVLRWLAWALDQVNRQRILVAIGALFLLLSARSPWYRLPPDALKAFETSLSLANIYRFLPILFAVMSFVFLFWKGSKHGIRLLLWSGLGIVLLFPYFQSTWTPTVAFLANSYYTQGAKVDRHVERNFSEIQAQWKQNIQLAEPEVPDAKVNFFIENSSFFQVPALEMFVTEGLAFNPSFFGFINPNWAIAILGFFVTLFGFYLEKSDRELRSLGRDMANILPWVGGGLLILFLSILIPSILHYQLNVAYAKGDYRFVQTTSKTLMAVYPPFRGDEAFLERMAKAGYYGDSLQDGSPRAEPELIEFVKGLESYRQSDWLNAETHFHNSLEQQPKNFLARAYLANAIVNRGVAHLSDANHRQAGTAADLFERALQIFPYHTEALYDLTIARTINGEFERSANNALKIIESQKYAQRPRPALLGQAYLHLTWRGFKDDNLERAWQRYRQSVDDGAWKDVIEGES